MSADVLVGDESVDAALDLIVKRLRGARLTSIPSVRPGTLLDLARAMYRERRQREQHLGALASFGEPAWDILLDLYIAAASGGSVSVNSACIAACVPPTTGLRWLAMLEIGGAISRTADANDRRRSWVALTEEGEAAMVAYLQNLVAR